MDDLNSGAVAGDHHVLRLVGLRGQMVFRQRQPSIHWRRVAQFGQGQQRAEGHGAAGHVGVHVQHAAVGFQVHATGIEADAFADQCHGC